MAKLEVEIGADKKEFDLKVKEVEKDIQDLSKVKLERIKLGLDTKDINLNIKEAKKSLNDLKTSLKDTGQSFTAMQKPVANGGNTLMQFSRIAQDAPFGIMGIGNNITATAESFSYLSASSGGAGNALKAVASSMLGTGGILLAVSLVTSALTYMSQNGITVGDVFRKLIGDFDSAAESAKKLSDEFAKSIKESAKTSGQEIAQIKAYLSVAKDRNLSDQKRLLAVKEVQDKYPAYFGNLSKERILNGEVASAVDSVSRALIARANASAIAGKLGDLAAQRLILEEKREQAILEIKRAQLLVAKKQNAVSTGGGGVAGQGGGFTTVDNREQGLLIASVERYKDIQMEIKVLDSVSKKYSERNNKEIADSIDLLTTQGDTIKKVNEETIKGTKQSFGGGFIGGGIVAPSLNSGFAQSSALLNANIVPDVLPEITQKTKDIEAALLQFDENTKSIIGDSIASTFMNLGQVIGEALANGGNVLQSAGNSLLSAVGGLLSAMGGELIKLGTAAVLAGTVTKTFGSIVGIGAGIAAIAGGTLLSAAGAAISSKANKSVSGYDGQGGGVSTGANYSSPNTSGFGSSGSNSGTVVFEISGQSLIGVLSNTLDRNSRLGGALSIG